MNLNAARLKGPALESGWPLSLTSRNSWARNLRFCDIVLDDRCPGSVGSTCTAGCTDRARDLHVRILQHRNSNARAYRRACVDTPFRGDFSL